MTCAYLAGAIDIDGFISIDQRAGRQGIGYRVRIGISDTSAGRAQPPAWAFRGSPFRNCAEKIVICPFLYVGGRTSSGARAAASPVTSFQTKTAPRGTGACSDGLGRAAECRRGARRREAPPVRLYEEMAILNAGRRRRKHRVQDLRTPRARSLTREAMANETPLWASAPMPLRALPGRVTISPRRRAAEQRDE
jgi:hypothetical protein